MNTTHILIVSGVFLTFIIKTSLAFFSYQNKHKYGAKTFTGLMFCLAIYSLGYGFDLMTSNLSVHIFLVSVQYLGISYFPVFALILMLQYAGKEKWLSPRLVYFLFSVSTLFLLIVITNKWHYLFYSSYFLIVEGPFPVFHFVPGPWYWFYQLYMNTLLLLGMIMLMIRWLQLAGAFRRQIGIIILGAWFPWLGYFYYVLGFVPYGIDITPLTFTITGLLLAFGIFRYRLLTLIPIARDLVFESMNEGVLVLDEDHRIIDYNRELLEIFPDISPRVIGESITKVLANNPGLLEQATTNTKNISIQVASKKEQIKHYNCRLSLVTNRHGQIMGKVLLFADVTEQVGLMQKLWESATKDSLTGTYNRDCFWKLCHKTLKQLIEEQKPFALIIIDLDDFKKINDTYGHQAGDQVLRETAQILQKGIRPNDILARLGGEEFIIFLPETLPDTANKIAQRLRHLIEENPITIDNNTVIRVTGSFGVTGNSCPGNDVLDKVIKQADIAMYQAKKAGKNRVTTDI